MIYLALLELVGLDTKFLKLLYLSKYSISPAHGTPTRQFQYCQALERLGNWDIWLLSSRSCGAKSIEGFRGLSKESTFGRLRCFLLNGPLVELGFSFKRIFSWLWFEFQLLRFFPRIRKWKPDVIYVSSLSLLTVITGLLFKMILRRPLVVEIRDIYPQTLISVGGLGRYHPAVIGLSLVEKLAYKYSDAITSSLPNLEPHVQRVLGTHRSVEYLPMGYDSESPSTVRLSELGLNSLLVLKGLQGNFIVGYAGTIGLVNALAEPLEAFRQLSQSHPHIHLVIFGDGPLRSNYQNQFGELNNIHFLGQHPKTDLPNLLKYVSVVIHPSIRNEIYDCGISPNKWIDYLAASKPILAPYSGFKFLLDEYECGWFIEPQDVEKLKQTLIELSLIPNEVLNKMGKNGLRHLVDHLPYSKLAIKFRKILDSVISCPEINRTTDEIK